MEKSFATDDHDQLLAAADGHAFTFFERSYGRGSFTKSASDVISKLDLQNHMPPDTHFGVHLISMGSEEDYGANRNGDSASRRSLQEYHPTFEKFGNVFREHNNKDPRKRCGDVKLARYNPRMNRGELIVWVDKDKAPDMYKAAKAGKELSWSMSMRLPHDECSCCRKKSKRTTEYCSHLRNSMLQFVPGFEKYAYARNEEGVKFFDISEVKRRADRIATYLGYTFSPGDMAKAASSNTIITGAQWAEHQFGVSRAVPFDAWEDLTLDKLAAAEEFVRNADANTLTTLYKMAPRDLTREQIETLAGPDFRSVGGELAKKAMIINFMTFASMVTNRSIEELQKDAALCDAMDEKMPSLLSDMARDGGSACGEEVADSVSPDEVGCSFSPGKDNIDRLMQEVGDECGMKPEDASNRALSVTIMKTAGLRRSGKLTEVDAYYSGLIAAYGHYVVKAAHQIKDLPGISTNTLFRGLAASLSVSLR